MNKILVICGPTASGKTSLGITIAKKHNGEIISADSRQVYIGMNIATGKDLPQNAKFVIPPPNKQNSKLQIESKKYQIGYYLFEGVPVWMLDIVKPNQDFSVAHYVEIANDLIEDLWRRGKLPVILGGTGFYIKALIEGIETIGIPPDWKLRKDLSSKPARELFEMLARLDSSRAASMNFSDRSNPRRLVRAIEVALCSQKSEFKKIKKLEANSLSIGLTAPLRYLYDKVDQRIVTQTEDGETEIRGLLQKGYGWNLPAMSAMGYGVLRPFIEGRENKEEAVRRWKFDEHAYVRRQMTWFNKDKRIVWFDISKDNFAKKVAVMVNDWYNKK